MAVSFHKFIDRLNRSGLLTTKDLQRLLTEVTNDQRPGNAESLARWLVQKEHLTPFQAKAIYLGHTKGMVVGNYIILDLLGVGGMGQVYKAQHRRMKRVVALKLLSPEVAKQDRLVQRFHQEVEAAAKLMHPNIVTAFDADESNGKHFLVMEYVPGCDLGTLVRQGGPLSVDRSIRCVLDAARGLAYAHRNGIVHRDIKPANLLLTSTDEAAVRDAGSTRHVKILDMGLARIEEDVNDFNKPSDLTRSGIVMGTVDYMSPEQAVNTHDAGPASDIYSLGITLHYLLLSEVPFKGRTVIEQVLAHRESPIPVLKDARPSVPAALDLIFRHMIAKQASARYASMDEVVDALEGVLDGKLDSEESSTDLPSVLPDGHDGDMALVSFLDSMSGGTAAKRQAAAAVITPDSTSIANVDTMVTSDYTTKIGPLDRLRQRRQQQVPWKAILLHSTWSLGLLGAATWLFLSSREPEVSQPLNVVDPAIFESSPITNGNDATVAEGPTDNGTIVETASNGTTDADFNRGVASWVLSKGGAVLVGGVTGSEYVLPGQPLPRWDFFVTTITLPPTTVSGQADSEKLREVAELSMLQTLVLAGCPAVTDDWLTSISSFDRLVHLDIRGTTVTDDGVITIAEKCPQLETLHLGACPVNGPGLAALASLTTLRELGLNQTPITVDALPHLKALTTLRQLSLRRTVITSSQLRALRRALPDCTIASRRSE